MKKNNHLTLVSGTPPTSQKRTVSREGKTNGALRSREHLTPPEIETLIQAARKNRYGGRDSALIMVANQGTDTRTIQGYLGHKNIRHTVRYTELAPTRFKGLFE